MLTHECKGNASYKHLSIKQENIDLYYKNKPRIFATVPKIEHIKELNAQYRKLRKEELVYCVELKATNGIHSISNREVIVKIIDLLIRESQKQIESEVK